jgi:thiol:disulfide interchange protein
MRQWQFIALALLALGLVLAYGTDVSAQPKKSSDVVKATAKADKPGEDGKQVVTITLEIDPKYHLYANPVKHEDFEDNATVVTVTGKEKPESVKVEYPAGKEKESKLVGKYMIYKDKVTIKAVVQRAKGDSGPLAVAIKVQACDENSCLQPGTVKVAVE